MTEEKGTETTDQESGGEGRVIPPSAEFSANAHIKSMDEYRAMHARSVDDADAFWAEKANELLDWIEPFETVRDGGFDDLDYRWFPGGKLNVSANCLDRHLENGRRDKTAIIWEGDSGEVVTFTYAELHTQVVRFANVLKANGVGRGDRVAIYMPMIPELAVAMLACTRIGAIHSIVFGGFSASALRDRINDCGAKVLVTADEGLRGTKTIPLKAASDEAMSECPGIETCVVVRRTGGDISMQEGRDVWWHEQMEADGITDDCPVEAMDAEDPLFVLYTSGSTGKPKGVLHTTGGYLLYTTFSFKNVFDYHEEDVYWCTADIGWITGHSYIVYGPLAAGATTLMFEGVPTYPDAGRFWDCVVKHDVAQFYTAPTAIRALMKHGDEWPDKYDMKSLKLLGTVGEPINPEVWEWYYRVIGGGEIPVVDTYWQTETGGHIITPIPGAIPLKPGSATVPFFGVDPVVLREDGSEADVGESGFLCIRSSWPGMLRGTWGDPEHTRMREVYFSRFPGYYFTGDGARLDEDGYYWLLGRVDDVINVSGHRMGTAEVESALVSHPACAEAAVVGFPHEVKGEGIFAYVTLKSGETASEELARELVKHVRTVIGPIATPEHIQFTRDMPKTRSGKIMRRILRKIAGGETDMEAFGDISTLADPAIVEDLVKGVDRY
jgi:acetyl-CoA synthetase